MAAGPHLMGHGLLNWSVRRLRAFTVNIAVLGEPVLATIYAALLFGEIPGPSFYAGAILIVSGIVLASREERGDPAAPSL
jgi:drug/metabolite transporter (DMT)-like permease